jgi:penicillin-binding protein 1A
MVGVGLIAAMVGALALAIGGGVYVLAVASTIHKLAGRKAIVAGASSEVFAAEGTRLGFIQSEVLRTPVGTEEMPKYLRQATISIEDQRFYENDGVDLTGIFR